MQRLLLASDTHHMRIASFAVLGCFFAPLVASAENPHWIWHDNHGKAIQTNEVRYFRKTFQAPAKFTKAHLNVAADDEATVYINGRVVAAPSGYETPVRKDITDDIRKGTNVIAIRGHNIASDVAGVIALLEIKAGKTSTF